MSRSSLAASSSEARSALAAEYAEKLRALAERTHVPPGTLAQALLSSALDEADPSACNVTQLLDDIDGAFDRARAGLAAAAEGNVIRLEDL